VTGDPQQQAQVRSIQGGRDRPSWAPAFFPSASTLDYIAKLATVILLALGALYFLGIERLRPFARHHVAAV
jgi:hypothetical protein